jgi:hypothetical protein
MLNIINMVMLFPNVRTCSVVCGVKVMYVELGVGWLNVGKRKKNTTQILLVISVVCVFVNPPNWVMFGKPI